MSVAFQTNGVPSGAPNGTNGVASQSDTQQSATQPSDAAAPQTQSQSQTQPNSTNPQQQQQQPTQPQQRRPRDVRTMELLLTAQGVTAYEARVPQLLLDFAYRHAAAVLSDALHLSADPYTSHAGARPSAQSGAAAAAPNASGDAAVSANAVQLAIASRLAFQFRGGAGGPAAGGGPSKEWLLELARERNKTALPRVGAVEWGTRLPSERFVLSGVGWGLRDAWAAGAVDDDDDEEEDEQELDQDDQKDVTMGGVDGHEEDGTGEGVEGGTIDDVFEDDGMMEDEEMGV